MKEYRNQVFIATSLDGYIADENGGIDWLHSIPNPEGNDMGYGEFISQIDAVVMGRITFETVCDFNMEWPYTKPVFVLSNRLTEIPEELKDKAQIVRGSLTEVLEKIHRQGYHRLYIDGGQTIRSFLKEDLIDDIVITIIPVLLGGGLPLFSELSDKMEFECSESRLYLNKIVQNRFQRIR
jgi:dihydrofolate reductase